MQGKEVVEFFWCVLLLTWWLVYAWITASSQPTDPAHLWPGGHGEIFKWCWIPAYLGSTKPQKQAKSLGSTATLPITGQRTYKWTILQLKKKGKKGIGLWHNKLRVWHCHCCGSSLIPDPGTSTCCGGGQKKGKETLE